MGGGNGWGWVGPMVTVSAAVGVRALGVRALGVVALVVGVGAAVLGCWSCAWFLRWCGVALRWT